MVDLPTFSAMTAAAQSGALFKDMTANIATIKAAIPSFDSVDALAKVAASKASFLKDISMAQAAIAQKTKALAAAALPSIPSASVGAVLGPAGALASKIPSLPTADISSALNTVAGTAALSDGLKAATAAIGSVSPTTILSNLTSKISTGAATADLAKGNIMKDLKADALLSKVSTVASMPAAVQNTVAANLDTSKLNIDGIKSAANIGAIANKATDAAVTQAKTLFANVG